jgi:hypothetical protein
MNHLNQGQTTFISPGCELMVRNAVFGGIKRGLSPFWVLFEPART